MPVPCFLLFLVSEKYLRKYSRNWTISFQKSVFIWERSRSPKERRRGAPRRRPHPMARVGPQPRHLVGSEPRGSTDAAPSPIYCSCPENPKHESHIPRKVPEPPSSTLTRKGSEALPGTLPERGIITDRKSTRLNSSHITRSRMPSSA